MQTSYPVFESGQVLTSKHLNDLVEFLEQPDRLTRNKLIGIGIVCGLEVGYEPAQNRVVIGAGCAVSSHGYLLVQERTVLTRMRPYTVPVPEVEEAPAELAEPPYPFFLDANGAQLPLWELFPADYVPGPGETPPTPVGANFLNDKVALLFLERNLAALKNCDINDCADKGAEMRFVLRTLVVSRASAQAMLARETQVARRPVDRSRHPGYSLAELRVAKLNPAAHGVGTYGDLMNRIFGVAEELAAPIKNALQRSYDAYAYLLGDMYPAAAFPTGPFGDPDYFDRVVDQVKQNIFLGQYFYAYLVDLVDSYNEFLRAAIRLDAECCPDPERFPRHVLIGEVVPRPQAFAAPPGQLGGTAAADPLAANTGLGPSTTPAPFRHHFVPSPLFGRQSERLQHVRSLHYRTYLLAHRFAVGELTGRAIRITPSRDVATLSERAIPFYYALRPDRAGDDLARNWSHGLTARNRLDQLFSHQFVDAADHPLARRLDDHDFYRVEGCVGKGLGEALRELIAQKRTLGLTFAIEPVFIGLSVRDDLDSAALEAEARLRAQQALTKLVLCRMGDLDVIFLTLMAALFQYLVTIIRLLARANTSTVGGLTVLTAAPPTPAPPGPLVLQPPGRFSPLVGTLTEVKTTRRANETLLLEVRPTVYVKGTITEKVTTTAEPTTSVGKLYQDIKDSSSTANLFDRTLEFVRLVQPVEAEIVAQRLYPAVSLLDKSEELLETVKARSLADFDFAQFEHRYDGFVQAYEAYLARPHLTVEPPAVVDLDRVLRENYSAVAATGPQSVFGGLVNELRQRMQAFFNALLMPAYVKQHPGVEHKGGVPAGGTLVLLYTHRRFLTRVVKRAERTFTSRLADVRAKLVGAPGAVAITDPERVLVAPAPTNALDDFVVLGDFCLPTLCCDTDCSDLGLPEPGQPPPPRKPGVVRGAVLLAEATGALRAAALERAVVTAVSLDTNEAVPVDVGRGAFAFSAPPGTYRLLVRGDRDVQPVERIVTIGEDVTRVEDFVLHPPAGPATPENPGTPGGPTTPTGPTIPTRPTIPTGPILTTDPVVPVTPVTPVTPTRPTIPTGPILTTDPVVPVTPVTPVTPTRPTIPTGPILTTDPVVPVTPVTPVTPTRPTIPTRPTPGTILTPGTVTPPRRPTSRPEPTPEPPATPGTPRSTTPPAAPGTRPPRKRPAGRPRKRPEK